MTQDIHAHIELDTFWPYHVTVLADQISRYTLSIVRAEAHLNQSQWRVLAAVIDKPGRTAAQVTAITPMDKTIVSRAVSSLIESGHIKKTPTEMDKRRLALEATPSGLKIYQRIATRLNEALAHTFTSKTSQQDLVATLKAYTAKMSALSSGND